MNERLYIGIDTSCYTTSLAAMHKDMVYQFKTPLEVKSGECGLRQSDAFFKHVKNMPDLFDELRREINIKEFEDIRICVSSRPRNAEGSYMPVFMAGYSFARTLASALNAELYEVSHQDGHIMAGIFSCKKFSLLSEPHLAFHISGGTTELLYSRFNGKGFDCEIVGGTLDLPAGQFIDRIGVLMGREFPCGKYLDYSAVNYEGDFNLKVKTSVKDGYINFSGEETRCRRMLEDGESSEKVSKYVMECIASSVKQAVEFAKKKYNVSNVIMAGGVSSSNTIRRAFIDSAGVYFASPELSCDNAVGVCELAKYI